jgi:predicted DNA-binding transcriptional regulator YafY
VDQPPHLEALQQAIIRGHQVRLGYAGPNRVPTVRTVHPLGLVTKATVWYLIAGTDADRRTFRVDRVTSVVAIDAPVSRPDDFDLGRAWEEILAAVDELRSPVEVEAMVDAGVLHVLRWMFGTQLVVGPAEADERLPVAIGGQTAELIAAQLAGFGRQVDITGPPAARRYLARVGGELVATYGSSCTSGTPVCRGRRRRPGPGGIPR